ncbi:MAG: O-antigen ligase family protein [Gammaproteobacteria bacterium]
MKEGNAVQEAPRGESSAPDGARSWWHSISWRWATTFLVLVFPFATLYVNRADSYTLGLLTLLGAWVWLRSGARRSLDRDSAWLCGVLALFFAIVLLSYLAGEQTDAGFRFLGRYLRFLLAAPVYLALRRYPPSVKSAFIGLAGGALLGGAMALWEFLRAHGAVRVVATTDLSIIFGDLTATMVLCTVAGFGIMAESRRRWAMPILVLCVVGGMAATLLSGTRGAWVAFLFLLLLLSTRFGGFLKPRYVAAVFAVIVLSFGISYLVPRTATHARLSMIGVQVRDYFSVLGTFAPRVDPSAARPRCLDRADFLRAWGAAGRRVGTAPAQVQVVTGAEPGPATGVGFGCRGGDALMIHNPGTSGTAQYVLPRVPEESARAQETELLARGVGVVSFVGGGENHASINATGYTAVHVAGGEARGDALNVFVAPGERVWLIPLERYSGEYSFAPADNNVGQRLELWRAAWHLFLQHPLLGVGMGAYETQTRELIRRHEIAGFVGRYDHPANDYFNILASAGIVGFLALLAVLVVPLARFARVLSSRDALSHTVGLAGALTVIGFAIYALTDTVFLHSMMITWYVIYMAMFYALLDARAAKLSGAVREQR